jgi:hypothetical protein
MTPVAVARSLVAACLFETDAHALRESKAGNARPEKFVLARPFGGPIGHPARTPFAKCGQINKLR